MCWAEDPTSDAQDAVFLTVDSLKGGVRPVLVPGQIADVSLICSGATTIIALSRSNRPRPNRQIVLFLDLRIGLKVTDVTTSLSNFGLEEPGLASISGNGTLFSAVSNGQMRVVGLPTCNLVYSGAGLDPKLSPDGNLVAFIRQGRLFIYSLADKLERQFLPGILAMGIGAWSPDGRLLLVGAWTKRAALEKRQIIIDTTTGRYAEIGTLQDGDYGTRESWISNGLMARSTVGR